MKNLYHNKHLILPQNYLAEEILLGTIFVHPKIFYNIIASIKAEYFFLECHKIIYTYLLVINKKNKLNLTEFIYTLANTHDLYKIGGINKILDLMKQSQIFIISFQNLNIYVQELIDLIQYNYIKRLIIQYGYNIIQLAYITQISHHDLYNKASSYLNLTENKIPKNNIKIFKNLMSEFLLNIKYKNSINKVKNNLIQNKILISGFSELDKLTFGLFQGDLIVIAGRPSTGKTSFAINIANNIIHKTKISLCIFSLEMSNKQILNKFISINSNIPLKKLILKNIKKIEWDIIIKTCYKLINTEIYIDDKPNISIDYIEYTSKLLKKENFNLNLIIIDYLQLIQTNFSNNINRTQELNYVTRKLKLLAQYLNIPIIVLSQLNRSIENRSNKKPLLSDLKDSGCIGLLNNITLVKNKKNNLNIKSFIKPSSFMLKINKIENFHNKLSNKVNLNQYIFFFTQYIFKWRIKKRNILLTTYNHKYIVNNIWKTISFTSENVFFKQDKNINNSYKPYNSYIQKIIFYNYAICYDLNTQDFFNFICNQIILHNSIEQDADVVMILNQRERNDTEINQNDLINIILCKNRNGPIGSFKLIFCANTTLFKNTDIDILTNYNL
uniref:DNA 5'-3' helicase n=1 Tax=Dasya binghamiae TaxID=1896963 RepID=A0A1C8XRZ3_9FLOR|nr:putative replicative DNA helicase [Dasya binghamiae]AOH77259.1 putative replicative DNA helicase [Dasya binghamiae]